MENTAENRQPEVEIDREGFEHVNGVSTGDRSPEGRPESPQTGQAGIIMLVFGSVAAVIALAAVLLIFLGPWIALVALFLGGGFAVAANPVIWSAILRSRERG